MNKPTHPGWYWYVNKPGDGPEIVRVDAVPELSIMADDFYISIDRLPAECVWGPEIPEWKP